MRRRLRGTQARGSAALAIAALVLAPALPAAARQPRVLQVDAPVTGHSVLQRGEDPACPGADARALLDERFLAPKLGPSDLHADLCGTDDPAEGSTTFTGTFRIATRSGVITGTVACPCDRPGGPFTLTVTGGTHRFHRAGGTLNLSLLPWFSPNDAGWISGTLFPSPFRSRLG